MSSPFFEKPYPNRIGFFVLNEFPDPYYLY